MERYILLKAPSESDQWFQSYEQSKDSQNNRKQRNSFLSLAISHNNAPDFWLTLLDCNTYIFNVCINEKISLYSVRVSRSSRSNPFLCDFLKNSWLLQQSVTIGVFHVPFHLRKCILLWSYLQNFTRQYNIKITATRVEIEYRCFSLPQILLKKIILKYFFNIHLRAYNIKVPGKAFSLFQTHLSGVKIYEDDN